MKIFNKIFGIGLPKTGTTSLMFALRDLGLYTNVLKSEESYDLIRKGQFKLPELDQLQSSNDCPISTFFEEFDRAYPGSLFIWTIREKQDWLASCEKHWGKYSKSNINHRRTFNRIALFGIVDFNPDRFEVVYDSHKKRVESYFDSKDNFLKMNVKDGWETLCSFLDIEEPSIPFPWKNKA